MWLPALGAALFVGAAIWLFGTGKPTPEAKQDSAPAIPAATDSARRKPDPKQLEEQLKMLQERFKGRGAQPPPQAH